MKIRNWKRHQHFKNRRPPWIKLYRDVLDDIEWHELPAESAKTLVMLWLIASEGGEGYLPDIKTLSFRLRTTEKKLNDTISTLSNWLEQDDINTISTRYQNDPSETETETETETSFDFEKIWGRYPSKDGRKEAHRHFMATVRNPDDFQAIEKALENYLASDRVKAGYVKNGSTWFNNWRDWINAPVSTRSKSLSEAILDKANG